MAIFNSLKHLFSKNLYLISTGTVIRQQFIKHMLPFKVLRDDIEILRTFKDFIDSAKVFILQVGEIADLAPQIISHLESQFLFAHNLYNSLFPSLCNHTSIDCSKISYTDIRLYMQNEYHFPKVAPIFGTFP